MTLLLLGSVAAATEPEWQPAITGAPPGARAIPVGGIRAWASTPVLVQLPEGASGDLWLVSPEAPDQAAPALDVGTGTDGASWAYFVVRGASPWLTLHAGGQSQVLRVAPAAVDHGEWAVPGRLAEACCVENGSLLHTVHVTVWLDGDEPPAAELAFEVPYTCPSVAPARVADGIAAAWLDLRAPSEVDPALPSCIAGEIVDPVAWRGHHPGDDWEAHWSAIEVRDDGTVGATWADDGAVGVCVEPIVRSLKLAPGLHEVRIRWNSSSRPAEPAPPPSPPPPTQLRIPPSQSMAEHLGPNALDTVLPEFIRRRSTLPRARDIRCDREVETLAEEVALEGDLHCTVLERHEDIGVAVELGLRGVLRRDAGGDWDTSGLEVLPRSMQLGHADPFPLEGAGPLCRRTPFVARLANETLRCRGRRPPGSLLAVAVRPDGTIAHARVYDMGEPMQPDVRACIEQRAAKVVLPPTGCATAPAVFELW